LSSLLSWGIALSLRVPVTVRGSTTPRHLDAVLDHADLSIIDFQPFEAVGELVAWHEDFTVDQRFGRAGPDNCRSPMPRGLR